MGGRVYAGQSARERSEARRRQFLDAGLEVLGTRGWANTTVRAICEEAGLSNRFFYEAFRSLDALALELYDEIVRVAFAAVVEGMTDAGPDRLDQSRAGVEALVVSLADDPRRARIVLVHAVDNPGLGPRRREMLRNLTDIIASFGRTVYGRDPDDPIVRITATMVAGGVAELLLAWVDGVLEVTREELIDSCARLVIGTGDTAHALSSP